MNAKAAAKPATAKPETYYARKGLTVVTVSLTPEEREIIGKAAAIAGNSVQKFLGMSGIVAAVPLVEAQAAKDLAAAKRARKKSSANPE